MHVRANLWNGMSHRQQVHLLQAWAGRGADLRRVVILSLGLERTPVIEVLSYEQIYVLGRWALFAWDTRLMQALLQRPCALLKEKLASYFFFRGRMDLVGKIIPPQFLDKRSWLWNEMHLPETFNLETFWREAQVEKFLVFLDK